MLTFISIPENPCLGQKLKEVASPLSYEQRLEVLKFDRFCDLFFKQLQEHGYHPSRHLLGVICANEEVWGQQLSILSLSRSLDDVEEKIQLFFEVPRVPEEDLQNKELSFHLIRRRIIWSNLDESTTLEWDGDQLQLFKGRLWHPETEVAISLYREEYRDEQAKVGLFILNP